MAKARSFAQLNFSAKVMIPLVLLMVLQLVLIAWFINHRIATQFRNHAAHSLETADSVFCQAESARSKNLLLRVRNALNEPRYKSAFQSKHLQTVREALKELQDTEGLDVALFTSSKDALEASAQRDPRIPIAEFQASCAPAIKQALAGQPAADTIRPGQRLFELVSVPVFGNGGFPIFGSGSAAPLGVLTVSVEIGETAARELSLLTHSQIVLLANGHVVASTLPSRAFGEQLLSLFNQRTHQFGTKAPVQVLLGDEHFYCTTGRLASLNGDASLGYLLFSSYEQSLRAFASMQQTLLLVGGCGVLLVAIVVGWLVRRTTRPLRELQLSAECVGRGDFSHRVEVTSSDECGKLARAFNQMTENVQRAQQQLESTVTTLKSTQAQLIQSEKLSGIGEFVAGVAHELNNPLTAVMGFSEMLIMAPNHPQQQRYLDLICKGAQRCQKIVHGLLSFARRHPPERRLGELNALLEDAAEFMQYQLRTSNIELVTELDRTLPKTLLDSHQLQQVFLNIINNARQAIESTGSKGRVLIRTENLASRARITIQDNGPGIPEEYLPRLFDPFFTTKEIGKGTGLGLSFSYGVVSEHGGTIQVQSKPGEGATFIIELPLVAAAEPPAAAPLAPAPLVVPAQSGAGKRVLVIDDEECVLEVVRTELMREGYQVDVVQDGEAALQRLNETQYDLALCDWKMPGLNGGDVYERLKISNPALCERVVFITGDLISTRLQKFLSERRRACLAKPFSLSEFRAAVAEAFQNNANARIGSGQAEADLAKPSQTFR